MMVLYILYQGLATFLYQHSPTVCRQYVHFELYHAECKYHRQAFFLVSKPWHAQASLKILFDSYCINHTIWTIEYSVGTFVQMLTYLFLLFLNHQLSSSILTCHFRLCHRYNKTSFCNHQDSRLDLVNIALHNFHQTFLILPKVMNNYKVPSSKTQKF